MTAGRHAGGQRLAALQFGHSVAAVDDEADGLKHHQLLNASIRPQRRRRG